MTHIQDLKNQIRNNRKELQDLLEEYQNTLAPITCCVGGCGKDRVVVKNLFNFTLYPLCDKHKDALFMCLPGPQINPGYNGGDIVADFEGRMNVRGTTYIAP